MKRYDTKDLRNIAILGQRGAGKTSLAEALIFNAGHTSRLGNVDEATSIFDTEPEEIKRHSTIHTAIAYAEWKKRKVNVLDVPGAADFNYDMRMSLRVADAAVLVVGATDGVQVGTEKAWVAVQERGLPGCVYISQMDRERANFEEVLASVQADLTRHAAAVQVPIGKEAGFKGVVDLVAKKALVFSADGKDMKEEAIPADLADTVATYRDKLLEMVAETDDALMEKFFGGELTDDDLKTGLAKAITAGKLVPVLCGAAKRNLGVQPLMDLVVNLFPSPDQRPALAAKKGEEPVTLAADPDKPFVGLVFKTASADIGKLSLVKVVQGTVVGDTNYLNANKGSKERFGQVYTLLGKKREAAEKVPAGDIFAVAKLKDTKTGDTVTEEKHPVVCETPSLPLAVARFAVRPKTKADEDKLGQKLNEVADEDPTLAVLRDAESGEIVVGGIGQIHIDTTVERLRRSGVEVEMGLPRIPYRETIKKSVGRTEGKHKKQTGGRGQFGVCYIEMEPLPRGGVGVEDVVQLPYGGAFVYEDAIFGGSIPRQWIPSVEKGIRERMRRGVIAGYPVVDIKVRLVDGKYHDVDSSDFAFQLAGSKGFQVAVKSASPCLLEPIYLMDITVPEECMGDVMGDITSKRGRPIGSDNQGRNVTIKAMAPLSEIQRYSADLESMTSGRGTFTMYYDHYEEVPGNLAEKIIANSKVEEDEE
jgi:elongation factor G